ncbi:MAG: zinc ribbon domain-containing protein [Acidobacteriia bacterium]|nr:zinc ribbon domain-containing protein [Terriglobia bacterium]
MPIYEYACDDCGTQFEKLVLKKSEEIACPKCAGKKNTMQLSVFSANTGAGKAAADRANAIACTPPSSGGCCGGGRCGVN